jgi:hypothetical protein
VSQSVNPKRAMIEETLLEDLENLAAQPVMLQSNFQEMFCVTAALQLALRHPEFPDHTREIVTRFTLDLQKNLSVTPAIGAVLEMGWGMTEEIEGTKCRVCGCTNEQACPGGCSWVEPDLCSACAPAAHSIIRAS